MTVLNMSHRYNKLPSEILHIDNDDYTAFCFDEACDYIMNRIEDGDKPIWTQHYGSFTELYEQYK